jgi:hypothetical protein
MLVFVCITDQEKYIEIWLIGIGSSKWYLKGTLMHKSGWFSIKLILLWKNNYRFGQFEVLIGI